MLTYVLLVTGLLTAGAFVVTLVPRVALRAIFGAESLDGLTRLIARHWGLLVGLVGCLLVFAAYHPEVRTPVMIVAVVEKLVIAGLVFASPMRTRLPAALVATADAAMAAIYLWFLLTASFG